MKKVENISNMVTRLCAMLLAFTLFSATISATPAYAAASNESYGFTFDDSGSGRTVYRFHKYNASTGSYTKFREFYSKGSYVYRSGGTVICNNCAGNGSAYCGYDINGNFYIICKDGSVTVVSTENKASTLIKSGALRLGYNANDVAVTVLTSGGNKYLSNLEKAPETDNDDTYTPNTTKASARVDIYTNASGELVYEAYNSSKLKTKIVVSSNGKSVLNATAGVRLTDTLKGAKFLGFDTDYNVYLYESDTLYRFTAGSWYSAQKLNLSSNFASFSKDTNGFITKVVTASNESYTMKQLTSTSWKAKKTYVVSKSGYKTLYVKGSTKSYTLSLKSGKLSLNGKQVATGVKSYGFLGSKKIIYLKGKKVYTATINNPTTAKKLYSNGKKLKTNGVGLVTKVVTTKGTKKVA